MLLKRLSWGVWTKCDDNELASTNSGTISSIVLAPNNRMFISNSSYLDHVSRELAITMSAASTHPEDLYSLFDALLSVRTECIQERPPNTHSLCAQCDSLEHITRATHASIDVDFELRVGEIPALSEGGDDLDKDLDSGARGVELAPTVVGEHDTLNTCFICEDRVFGGADALQDDRH